MGRLPEPGGDSGSWGAILNDYLTTSLGTDGTIKPGVVSESNLADAVKDKLNAVASGGATNLAVNSNATSVTVSSDTGNDATISSATTSAAGVLTAADKSKLDGVATGAQVNAITSVAGRTGAVTLTKTDVGLPNVDNTSDLDKPVSTLTQTALNAKAAVSHTHSLDTLTNVSLSAPSTGQVLKYNGTSWVNDSDATAGGSGNTNLSATSAASTVTVVSDTGTDAVVGAATASAAGVLTAADKSKLDGIAAGATLNSTDAELRGRATHTGTQAAATISDFAETVRDVMATALVAGSNVTIAANDNADTITISSTGGGGGSGADIGVITTNSQSGTAYTLVDTDTGKVVETTSSSMVTLTVPPNNSVAFPIGATIAIRQFGTGQVTVVGGFGVTLLSRGAVFKLGGQYSEAMLTKRSANEWILSGDLTA